MRQAVDCSRPGRTNKLILAYPIPSLLASVLFVHIVGVIPEALAEDPRVAQLAVPQAKVAPRVVRLPVIEGTDIAFARLSTVDGLSQTKVSQIVQDQQGFMWFGTQYGLNRYDGYNFKVFVHDPRNPKSLSGAIISALFKDRQGRLWVGCEQFVDRFEGETEGFIHYPIRYATHISQDSAGTLWLASGEGLYSLDPSTGKIRRYSHDPAIPSSLPANEVKSSGEDRRGRFWVATSQGLHEFDRKTGRVTLHVPLREPLRELSFYEDHFGMFWIIHASGTGLAVFERETNTLTHYSFRERDPASSLVTGVMAMLEDRSGNLWFATQGAGLLKFDREHQRFIGYRNIPAKIESLAQDRLNSLFEDREGNIWAGFSTMGTNRFSTKPPLFKTFPYDLRNPHSKGETFVGAIYEDREGIVWIGTRDALNRINRKTDQYTFYRTAEPGIGSDVISIIEDRSGALWVGTFNQGLHLFNRRTGRFKTYRHDAANRYSLSNDIVTRLVVDHNGALWAATWNGLNRFDLATERFTKYKPDTSGTDLYYIDLIQDKQGVLWLGSHQAGLHRFDPATGQFTIYDHQASRLGTISDNRVNAIHFDRSGVLWVGTQNGLNRFDSTSGTFAVYTNRDGLPGNVVSCILEDKRGDLWMSTNEGVSRFDSQRTTFKNFSIANGLPGPDLTGWGACFKSPSGEMFFGGFSGATAFQPDKIVDIEDAPPIALTGFRLSGNEVEIGERSPLKKSISLTSEITLSHRQNVFSLTFAALSYFNPAANRYRYKLEGLDHEWNEVGSDRRQVGYTTLPVGEYTFRAQGATSHGPWSEPGVALRIRILPPWWGTWWFRAVAFAVAGGLLWTLHLIGLRQIAREFNARLDERVNERTRIARELHDTLLQSFHGLIFRFQAVDNLLPARPGEAKQTLESALDDAAQAITEARDAVHELRSSTMVTNDLAAAVIALGEELAAHHTTSAASQDSATVLVEVEGTPQDLHPILRDEIYRIAGEALRNAFHHARARRIEVEIRYDDRELRVRVRDDGSGIDPSILSNEERAGHWGLPGMRERAKRIGGQMDLWSELGAGTEVELRVPASIAYQAYAGRSFRLFRKITGTKL